MKTFFPGTLSSPAPRIRISARLHRKQSKQTQTKTFNCHLSHLSGMSEITSEMKEDGCMATRIIDSRDKKTFARFSFVSQKDYLTRGQ